MAIVYYLAKCRECAAGQFDEGAPFDDEDQRDNWALAHAEGTNHAVDLRETVR